MKFFDRVKMRTATTGTGDIALGTAPLGFRTLEEAGAADGDEVPYVIQEGASFARGLGTWTESTNTLVRDADEVRWTGGVESVAKLSLAGTAMVYVGLYSEILEPLANAAPAAAASAAAAAASEANAEAFAASAGCEVSLRLTGSPVPDGGHIVAWSQRGPFTYTRFVAATEGGSADISVRVNEVEVHAAAGVEGEEIDAIEVETVQGDRIEFFVDDCDAEFVWIQIDGVGP